MLGENIALVNVLCGVEMPDGMKENDKFPTPILTPTTKADVGHDEDISREEILAQGLVSKKIICFWKSIHVKFSREVQILLLIWD